MQETEANNGKTISNSKLADSGGKLIFEEPELCSQLFNDYLDMDILKNIPPDAIKDVTERFIPMFTEERNADVIKEVHLPDDEAIFIALIEHKSGVDYNVVMQILRYMVYIWEDYEKRCNKMQPGISKTKSFKYPPVFPIVYYEGSDEWTADMMLADRVALYDAFREFVPNFKYYLISLRNYDKNELINKRNELSFVMLINSIKDAEDFKTLKLPEGYIDELLLNSPDNVVSVLARIIAVVLRKQSVPEDEIGRMVDQIKRRKHMGLWDEWHGFNVVEERKKGELIDKIKLVCKKISKGKDVSTIIDELEADDESAQTEITEIIRVAETFVPNYDAAKIYDELEKTGKFIKA